MTLLEYIVVSTMCGKVCGCRRRLFYFSPILCIIGKIR